MRFRIITYNIHKGIGGVDRRYRPERISETLLHYQPDIVLLQEVDDGVPRSRGHRQVDLLGDALELQHRAYQRNVGLRRGHYGNAMLSRYPLYDMRNIELKLPLKKRRRAQVAHCRLSINQHSRTLLIINTHLGLAGFERQIQLRRILASEVFVHAHHRTPLVFAGDFNDIWGTLGAKLLEPSGLKPACGRLNTFPAALPMRSLDRIYYRGDLTLDHCFAARLQLAREASDHLPLIADFELVDGLR